MVNTGINFHWRYWFILIVLAALATLSWWLLQSAQTPQASRPGSTRHDPDFYLKDFTLTTMDKAGAPRNHLAAPSMVHYADDDSALLTLPHMTVFRKDDPPWHIDAEQGWISSGGKTVILHGKVMMRQTDPTMGREQIVRTTELHLKPDDEYAETDQPVTFRNNAGSAVDAVGMRASLKDEHLQLLSKVRGTYVSETP